MNFPSLLLGLRSVQLYWGLDTALTVSTRRINVILSLTQVALLNYLRVYKFISILFWFPNLHLRILKAKMLVFHWICIFFGWNIRRYRLRLRFLQLLYAPVSFHRIWVDGAVVDTSLLLLFRVFEDIVISDLIKSNICLLFTIAGILLIWRIRLHDLVLALSKLSILWNFIWLMWSIRTSDKHFYVLSRNWW